MPRFLADPRELLAISRCEITRLVGLLHRWRGENLESRFWEFEESWGECDRSVVAKLMDVFIGLQCNFAIALY